MLAVPVADGVKVAKQVAVPAVTPATRVQGESGKVPVAVPIEAKLTVPVGVTAMPAVVLSATVTVHFET